MAAERFGRPALEGVVHAIEADEIVAGSLASPASLRFRQTVGVAVRAHHGGSGLVDNRQEGVCPHWHILQAGRAPLCAACADLARNGSETLAIAALEAVELIGEEAERRQTAGDLLVALAESRRADNRPF